jgi:hypothetical protein
VKGGTTPVTYAYLDQGQSLPSWVTTGLTVNTGYVDAHGAIVSTDAVGAACNASDNFATCLQTHDWLDYTRVIPASDFWMIQGVETAFFVLLALGLLTFAVWYLARRGE